MKLNDVEINEHDALVKISEGAKLKEFDINTLLMRFAAVVHHSDGYKEIPSDKWTRLLAIYAVRNDFKAIISIPIEYRINCTEAFTEHMNSLTRETKDEWIRLFNEQDMQFVKKALRERPSASRYLNEKNYFTGKDSLISSAVKKAFSEQKNDQELNDFTMPEMKYDVFLDDIADNLSASGYFILPAEERTKETLMTLVDSDNIFPSGFIKRLIQPLRNEYLFKKVEDMEKAERARKNVLPFVNKDFCEMIAEKHPEAAIETPSFLKKEAVKLFMNKLKGTAGADRIKYYFVSFPEEMLDLDMIDKIPVDFEILNHAPNLLANTEKASKFLNRYPYRVLDLPEPYQQVNRIMKETVPLTRNSIKKIHNEALRENVAIALGL